MWGKIGIFTGKSIYKRETVSNKNIGLVIEYWYTSTIGTALQVWLVGLFPGWSPLLPYMADGTAHYAEKVGDTQHIVKVKDVWKLFWQWKKIYCLFTWRKTSKRIINVTVITIWLMNIFKTGCSKKPTDTAAIREPSGLPIDIPFCLYIVSLKLNEADSINSMNIYSGNYGSLKWP